MRYRYSLEGAPCKVVQFSSLALAIVVQVSQSAEADFLTLTLDPMSTLLLLVIRLRCADSLPQTH